MNKRTWIIAAITYFAGCCAAYATSVPGVPDITQNPGFWAALSGSSTNGQIHAFIHSIFSTDTPDLSLRLLSQIFGTVGGTLPGGTSGGLMANMFLFFNAGMLGLAGIFVSYSTIMGVFHTSIDGSIMQSKFFNTLVLTRSVAGVTMLVPKFSGYSFIQVLAMWIIALSVRAADGVWEVAVHFTQTQPIVSSLILPQIMHPAPGLNSGDVHLMINDRVANLLNMNYCLIQNHAQYEQNVNKLKKENPAFRPYENPYVYERPSSESKYIASFGRTINGDNSAQRTCGQYDLVVGDIPPSNTAAYLSLLKKTAAFEVLNNIVRGIAQTAYNAAQQGTTKPTPAVLKGQAATISTAVLNYLQAQLLSSDATDAQNAPEYEEALKTGWISAGWNYKLLLPQLTNESLLDPKALLFAIPAPMAAAGESAQFPYVTRLKAAAISSLGITGYTLTSSEIGHAPVPNLALVGDAFSKYAPSVGSTVGETPAILAALAKSVKTISPKTQMQSSQFSPTDFGQGLQEAMLKQRGRSNLKLANAACGNFLIQQITDFGSGVINLFGKKFGASHVGSLCGGSSNVATNPSSDIAPKLKWAAVFAGSMETADLPFNQDVQIFFYQIVGSWANTALPSKDLYDQYFNITSPATVWLNVRGGAKPRTIPIDPISRIGYFGDQLLYSSINFMLHATLDVYYDVYMRALNYMRESLKDIQLSTALQMAGSASFQVGLRLTTFLVTTPPGIILMAIGMVMGGVSGIYMGLAHNQQLFFKLEMHQKFMYLPIVMAVAIPIMVAGATMSFYVRLIPFIMYTLVVIGWFISVFETIVAAPLVAMGVTHPEGHDFLGQAEQAQILMAAVFIRPIAIVIGFIAATALSFVMMWMLNTGFIGILYSSFASIIGAANPADVATLKGASFVDAGWLLMCLVVYIYISMSILEYCYSMIHELPYMLVRWIGGQREYGMEDQLMSGISQGVQDMTQSVAQGAGQTGKGMTGKVSPVGARGPLG